ncbi:MAG TPA: class I SAM-dependent methyltransferase [Thermoanaerobaculia bacterium]|jgi:SAM-dependent methyltransferase|nr:class I SAM-dependent methyltransferase [Thermoanaerobaculia bacterium]
MTAAIETRHSTFAKMNGAYGNDLAYIHDSGFGDFARGAAGLMLEELRHSGLDHGLVIDLGCGSGILSEPIAAQGFDVLGIDVSEAFVALARQRVPQGQFRVESLLKAEIPPCVGVAAVGEVLNYLFDGEHSVEGIQQVLKRIFAALAPGGALIFDVAEPGRVPGGSSKTHMEKEDWAVLATVEEDPRQSLLTRSITTFRKVGDLYRRSHEVHRQRLLPRAQVLSWLQDIGFQARILDAYGSVPFGPGHVGFLARKPV